MSVGCAPASGYVVKATRELFERLNIDWHELAKTLDSDLALTDFDEFISLLAREDDSDIEIEIGDKTVSVQVFQYFAEDGDIYDSLEEGCYLFFDEDDLFVKHETEANRLLRSVDVNPTLEHWTIYG